MTDRQALLVSIVDDDEAVRESTRALLMSLGYSVSAFPSSEAFLQSDIVGETACLITDVRMPGLSGLDLQRRLIQDGHHKPVIFITAFPEEHMKARAMKAGAVCFLSKPYREESLIGCLDAALNGQRYEQA